MILVSMGFAETIYVPQDYSTIQNALYAANPGDSILISPGIFWAFMWDGNSKPNITVLGSGAYGANATKLQGNVSCDGVYLADCVGWEIGYMEITNFYSGVVVEHSTDIEIHHIYSHNNPYSYAYGIHSEFNDNIYIHHNVLAYNSYVALRIHNGNENVKVINNTLVHTNGYHGILVMDYQPNLQIINNIFAFNGGYGVEFYPSGCQGDAVITYNDNYGNGTPWGGCTPGVGTILLNPIFAGTGSNLYGLTANSPCVDTGDPQLPLDPDATRADIGAFYFDQAPDPVEYLTIQIVSGQVLLQWPQVPGVRTYNVYCTVQPYFNLGGLTPYAVVEANQYIDSAALTQNYYYLVTSYATD